MLSAAGRRRSSNPSTDTAGRAPDGSPRLIDRRLLATAAAGAHGVAAGRAAAPGRAGLARARCPGGGGARPPRAGDRGLRRRAGGGGAVGSSRRSACPKIITDHRHRYGHHRLVARDVAPGRHPGERVPIRARLCRMNSWFRYDVRPRHPRGHGVDRDHRPDDAPQHFS
ncbi:hypothetical protein C1I63_14535 [Rathayibacter caricis DSM 15933]|uniref:Uncharacterized protein n=1 Tax=Rathayibacter caricis DSM 15933 TaxID=1328867 RepID=A0A2T4UWN0_9MICO|nr:hypothetical protein C1I63_14535 [Rathayibacter caricis DSM 15933]